MLAVMSADTRGKERAGQPLGRTWLTPKGIRPVFIRILNVKNLVSYTFDRESVKKRT